MLIYPSPLLALAQYEDEAHFWTSNPSKYPFQKEQEVQFIQHQLIKGFYLFNPMLRTWIPKTKNPKELRPITKPAEKDQLVLDAMTVLMTEAMDPIFLDHSHGFIKRRGAKTLFPRPK